VCERAKNEEDHLNRNKKKGRGVEGGGPTPPLAKERIKVPSWTSIVGLGGVCLQVFPFLAKGTQRSTDGSAPRQKLKKLTPKINLEKNQAKGRPSLLVALRFFRRGGQFQSISLSIRCLTAQEGGTGKRKISYGVVRN